MAIAEIKIDIIEPVADGKVFGGAGSYIRIKGIAKGEIESSPTSTRRRETRSGWLSMRLTFLSCGRQSRVEGAASSSTT
jgi:hypothetical protein